MGQHKKQVKFDNLEKETIKKQKEEYDNFWSDTEKALAVLEKAYPKTPRAVLEINLRMYNNIRKMDREKKAQFNKIIDEMPDKPNLTDFKLGDDLYEDSGRVIKGPGDEITNQIVEESTEIIEPETMLLYNEEKPRIDEGIFHLEEIKEEEINGNINGNTICNIL
jgi:hypothetical protein